MISTSILLFFGLLHLIVCDNNLTVVSKARSANLEKYEQYVNAVILHFQVPFDSQFASFKFTASEQELSIFRCQPRDVSLYLKYGSPPVINPDRSRFPEDLSNITRTKIYNLEFKTDGTDVHVNVSSPNPGPYFAAVFLAYTDPRYNAITQEGLSPSCYAFVESTLSVKKLDYPTIIAEHQLTDVMSRSNESRYFKFFIPADTDHVILKLHRVQLTQNVTRLVIRTQTNKPPSEGHFSMEEVIFSNATTDSNLLVWVVPEMWHYLQFYFEHKAVQVQDESSNSDVRFSLAFFTNRLTTSPYALELLSDHNLTMTDKLYRTKRVTDVQQYRQYDLVRGSTSESFTFSFELEPELISNTLVPINMTNQHFSVFKFHFRGNSDVGGTLQYILAFKPRVKRGGSRSYKMEEEPKDNIIVGCIQNIDVPVPTWPNKCVSRSGVTASNLLLNSTMQNSTLLIPYPETGTWYASFKLFCGRCEPCECPDECQAAYETCVVTCESNCTSAAAAANEVTSDGFEEVTGNCEHCVENCTQTIVETEGCESCDCDGPCTRNSSNVCNSSVVFDLSSRPCYYGSCGKNGRCVYMVSEGSVYSTCVCSNRYRGFDCSDDTLATPYYLVLLELLLLVLTNIFFLPAVYLAYKRKYYVQCLCYFCIFFFSSFYHACDAGENIISYCLVRLGALQFADFFCALLAIWLTLIAIADVPPLTTSLFHMGGAIILAFCTTLNKTSFWIIILPTCSGVAIVLVSWFLKYRKFRRRFINRRYLFVMLPIGVAIVFVGMTIYVLLQTEDNYKYLHSMWHIIIATAIILLLPKKDTFQPDSLLHL